MTVGVSLGWIKNLEWCLCDQGWVRFQQSMRNLAAAFLHLPGLDCRRWMAWLLNQQDSLLSSIRDRFIPCLQLRNILHSNIGNV